MTISKILLLVLCLGSALGGAVLTRVVVSSGEECAVSVPQNQKEAATKKFWEGKDKPGPSKGF